MNTRNILPLICTLASAALLGAPGPVAAVELQVTPSSIYQANTGGGVYLGHTVSARTNFNRLVAGGTFVAACNDSNTMPLSGQRTLSSEGLTGPRSLVVTIPEVLPALRTIPGFTQVAYGTELSCTYTWTARAVESGFSIGAGGISFPIGSGEGSDGSTIEFRMLRSDGTSRGCIKD